MSMNYRPDIDGLRAIAVLLVVFQHLGFQFLSGGFIGVDVFFVISGFLITKILYQDIQQEKYSLVHFFKKRIVRLAPALFSVLVVTTLCAFSIFTPHDLLNYVESLLYSTLFTANIYMRQNAGDYFSPIVEEVPLLHLWSLGVEEQFYIFWPLILLFAFKYIRKNYFVSFVIVLILASLAFAEYSMTKNAAKAYYKMPVRAFELLIGSLIVFMPQIKVKVTLARLLVWVNILTLIVCGILFGLGIKFPGLSALIPCIATALIIYFGQYYQNNFILNNPTSIWFGKISYPLYLWHWPIIAFCNVYAIQWNITTRGVVFTASILAAFLTYKFIEIPAKTLLKYPARRIVKIGYLMPLGVVLLISLSTYLSKGFPNRFDQVVQEQDQALQMFAHRIRGVCEGGPSPDQLPLSDQCVLGVKKDQIDFLVLGDSHASAYTGMLDVWAKDQKLRGYDITQGGTFYMPGVVFSETKNSIEKIENKFKTRNDLLTQFLTQHQFQTIVLSGYYNLYLKDTVKLDDGTKRDSETIFFAAFDQAIQNAIQASERVIVLLDVPQLENTSSNCIMKKHTIRSDLDCHFKRKDMDILNKKFIQFVHQLPERYAQVKVIDPKKVFCNDTQCTSYIKNVPLYRDKDSNHLNYRGSQEIGTIYLERFGNPLVYD